MYICQNDEDLRELFLFCENQEMSGVEEKWERLVRAALRSARGSSDSDGKITAGIARNVPSSLANSRVIDEILKVADEIQDEDHTVARIREFPFTAYTFF